MLGRPLVKAPRVCPRRLVVNEVEPANFLHVRMQRLLYNVNVRFGVHPAANHVQCSTICRPKSTKNRDLMLSEADARGSSPSVWWNPLNQAGLVDDVLLLVREDHSGPITISIRVRPSQTSFEMAYFQLRLHSEVCRMPADFATMTPCCS
jgi:hypothetical protein